MNSQFDRRSSRRSVLKGAVVGTSVLAGAAGLVGGGVYLTNKGGSASAHQSDNDDNGNGNAAKKIQTILNIAITAEQLGVVFYTNVLKNADNLELGANARLDFRAAQIEEEIHRQFLAKQGAKPLTNKFSFPEGARTFKEFDRFLKTQQLLESVFTAAYLAAVKEFAMLKRPDLAQIAGQIAAIEAEHRVVGRVVGGLRPANNEAFAPILVKNVADAPAMLKKAGFLTPMENNSFTYQPVPVNVNGVNVEIRTPNALP